MRLPIWKKDDIFEIGARRIDMDPAVVELPEGVTPLTWNYQDDTIIGKVNNIRLEDGEILGDLEIKDDVRYEMIDGVPTGVIVGTTRSLIYEMIHHGDVRLGGFYSNIEQKNDRVLKAKLRSVSVILEWKNPGAKI